MVFVTGGSGYIGAHLICALLKKGVHVKALKRAGSKLDTFQNIAAYMLQDTISLRDGLDWVEGDICDVTSLSETIPEGCDVYHCAASVGFSARKNKQSQSVNQIGTANLVNVCLEKKVRRLCHASSIGTLGESPMNGLITENDDWIEGASHSQYARSKYLAELEVWRGIVEGLDAVIVNPAMITGPGGPSCSFWKFMELIENGLSFYPSGSNAWVDVRDVANAMLTLMEGSKVNERYILAAENIDYKAVLSMIAEALKLPPPKKLAGKPILKIASLAGNIRSQFSGEANPLSKDLVRILCNHSAYSSEKFINESGFNFITVRRSIEDACAFYTSLTAKK